MFLLCFDLYFSPMGVFEQNLKIYKYIVFSSYMSSKNLHSFLSWNISNKQLKWFNLHSRSLFTINYLWDLGKSQLIKLSIILYLGLLTEKCGEDTNGCE